MACTSMAAISLNFQHFRNHRVSLEASISDADDKLIALKDAKIVVESKDENKIQLRVDVTGIETQKVFNKVLTDLARQAPPIPGFRREKGGNALMQLRSHSKY
ncbi:hypothetical protein Godav_010086 [Gossypium davidsonii]|uniref:Trigger factor ribosome-binding bacterial domain-containing protein n=1 Tax=Gossypium davidsonii TaxID=34287 RepID=A0A7J8SFB3_GOSDV|nr:hypothetical protein [Gossypium davidsonii]